MLKRRMVFIMIHDIIVRDEGYAGLNPIQFGYEKCVQLHSFGPATRTHWLIHFVESGFGVFKIGEKEYNVGPGEMFVIPPFVETYYEADGKNPWSYIWIGFTADSELPVSLTDVIRCPKAAGIFSLMKNSISFENGRSAFLLSRLWDLFTLLLDDEKHNVDYVDTALDIIHSEYLYDITIERLAVRLGLDHSYFSSLFRKKIGLSPKEYLLNYRMNIAASLMIDHGNSVSVAAYSVGYTDVCNFSKMFKRRYGVSPLKYVQEKMNSNKRL